MVNENKTVSDQKQKKKKRSPVLAAAIVFGGLLLVLMITLAFFTSFDEVTNVFGGGRLDILLTEPHWKAEKARNIVPDAVLDKDPCVTNLEDTAVYVFLEVDVPYGSFEVEKNSGNDKGTALNTSPYGKIPLYKFGMMNDHNTHYDTTDDTIDYEPNYDSTAQYVNQGWVLVGSPEFDDTDKVIRYIYAHVQVDNNNNNTNYLSPLGKGVRTGKPLFNTIRLANYDENNIVADDYSVRVKAYGIQADFLAANNTTTNDPVTVWKIIRGE